MVTLYQRQPPCPGEDLLWSLCSDTLVWAHATTLALRNAIEHAVIWEKWQAVLRQKW